MPHIVGVAGWGPSSRKEISDIKQLQDRFIAGIKGRAAVENVKSRLGLVPLHILAKEERHSARSESYDEIRNQPTTTMTARSQTSGIPATFRVNNTQFHSSFLPLIIRDLNGPSRQTVSYSANTGLTPFANTI